MIGVVDTLARGVCRNCGGAILLTKSDLETHSVWLHDADNTGRLRRECPGATYAAPFDADIDGEWRIDITGALDAKGRVPLSLNDRLHWAAKASAIARVKAVTRNAVMAAGVPHLARVHVTMHYRPASNRFRDVDNTVATLKPAIDALHTRDESKNAPVPFEPIVDGDDPRFVTWSPPVLHPWAKGQPAALWLILRAVQ